MGLSELRRRRVGRPVSSEAVIVDVDGTLCDVSGVRHYVLADPQRRDYEAFHGASALCPPIPATLDWVEQHRAAGRTVFVVTARSQRWEFLTRRWMRKWGIRYDWLLMRADGDLRKDRLVKTDILARIRARGFEVVAAIDDNPNVIDLWQAEGIEVTVVPGWDEDASHRRTASSLRGA
ncbi:hypothetical protein MUN77_01560 [Leucobacter allii]|uniref:phosphatase domain-containing protein n=1 Tax=Leucobacter allii TaxID=2932247 RepID=UPI001FD05811|nr:HAD family acid phosphatase [Leucobacter allii]UOR02046.1 hypothetical protein MUN77_01560 [Leucobacter allii]